MKNAKAEQDPGNGTWKVDWEFTLIYAKYGAYKQ